MHTFSGKNIQPIKTHLILKVAVAYASYVCANAGYNQDMLSFYCSDRH